MARMTEDQMAKLVVNRGDPIKLLLQDANVHREDVTLVLRRAYWMIERECMIIPGSSRFVAKQIVAATPNYTSSEYNRRLVLHSERVATAMQHEREKYPLWAEVRREEALKYQEGK